MVDFISPRIFREKAQRLFLYGERQLHLKYTSILFLLFWSLRSSFWFLFSLRCLIIIIGLLLLFLLLRCFKLIWVLIISMLIHSRISLKGLHLRRIDSPHSLLFLILLFVLINPLSPINLDKLIFHSIFSKPCPVRLVYFFLS